MLAGPRLDPFSARLHAIHQKNRTFNPPPREEQDAQGLQEEAVEDVVGGCADTDEPALDLEPVPVVDTGCAECGGMKGESDPVQELRDEVVAIKARLAELETAVAALEMP